ncbi:MAG: ubiquinone/menaquinone biosynthesis methyltransferase [Omnitrophica WOR_2 bacterium]
MEKLSGEAHDRFIKDMFSRIAPHYDRMNRLMTAGQDARWRREVIRLAALPQQGRLLDLGAGTGDLAREALRQNPDCQPVAVDFSMEMMKIGYSKSRLSRITWAAGDVQRLPFLDGYFDAIFSGFLLRNVKDIRIALQEQVRVLKPGGRVVVLDTTPPPNTLFAPFIKLHLHVGIPLLGRLVARQPEAYRYLPASTESFLDAAQLAARMVNAGLVRVTFSLKMFGAVAIHWGQKPYQDGSN